MHLTTGNISQMLSKKKFLNQLLIGMDRNQDKKLISRMIGALNELAVSPPQISSSRVSPITQTYKIY